MKDLTYIRCDTTLQPEQTCVMRGSQLRSIGTVRGGYSCNLHLVFIVTYAIGNPHRKRVERKLFLSPL